MVGAPMSLNHEPNPHLNLDDVTRSQSTARRGRWRWLGALAILAALAGGLWGAQGRLRSLWAKQGPTLALLEVDRGDVPVVVVENGSLESADNATVKCKV